MFKETDSSWIPSEKKKNKIEMKRKKRKAKQMKKLNEIEFVLE